MKGNFNKIINDDLPVLIDFSADWCAPCKMLGPILKDLKSDVGDRLKIVKIDVDQNQSLANRYQVRGVPTMILFRKGEILWRQSGVMPKDALLQVLEPHLG